MSEQDFIDTPTRLITPEDYYTFYANSNRRELIYEIIHLSAQCESQNEWAESHLQEVETKNRLLKERDKKIANLHKVIAKQQLKIQRQAENITTLLHLYTSGKRSKSHKKLREKYRALKARMI